MVGLRSSVDACRASVSRGPDEQGALCIVPKPRSDDVGSAPFQVKSAETRAQGREVSNDLLLIGSKHSYSGVSQRKRGNSDIEVCCGCYAGRDDGVPVRPQSAQRAGTDRLQHATVPRWISRRN